MKLQTKIALGIIPLVLCSIFVLGLWSMKKTGENLHQSAFLYMDTIIDSYMQDINRHHDLLKNNGLDAIETMYVVWVFSPWNWVVFFAMDHAVLHAAERQIQMATAGIAVACAGLLILIILMVLTRFFVIPVRKIGRAAYAIAKGEKVAHIDVRSKDELGDLARHMEAMSAAIQQQHADIRSANEELEQRVKERTRDLETALSEIKTLRGIFPICSHCKKIRDDDGYWNQLETYIRNHSEAQLSHGICRECAEKYYPGLDLYDNEPGGTS